MDVNPKRSFHPPNQFICAHYRLWLGRLIGRIVLLLTTIGRQTGHAHTVPLQYERTSGRFVVVCAEGTRADWVRNLLADPRVTLAAGSQQIRGLAEVVCDPVRIAEFLMIRLRKRPGMMRILLKSAGLPARPTRQQLMAYSEGLAMVVISPVEE